MEVSLLLGRRARWLRNDGGGAYATSLPMPTSSILRPRCSESLNTRCLGRARGYDCVAPRAAVLGTRRLAAVLLGDGSRPEREAEDVSTSAAGRDGATERAPRVAPRRGSAPQRGSKVLVARQPRDWWVGALTGAGVPVGAVAGRRVAPAIGAGLSIPRARDPR
jgi:hypothetical protein